MCCHWVFVEYKHARRIQSRWQERVDQSTCDECMEKVSWWVDSGRYVSVEFVPTADICWFEKIPILLLVCLSCAFTGTTNSISITSSWNCRWIHSFAIGQHSLVSKTVPFKLCCVSNILLPCRSIGWCGWDTNCAFICLWNLFLQGEWKGIMLLHSVITPITTRNIGSHFFCSTDNIWICRSFQSISASWLAFKESIGTNFCSMATFQSKDFVFPRIT